MAGFVAGHYGANAGLMWRSWIPACAGMTKVWMARNFSIVIPAQAGIQRAYLPSGDNQNPLDSRLRWNHKEKPCCAPP